VISWQVGLRVRNCLMIAVYEKAMTLSALSKGQVGVGKIVNLISNDSQKILEGMQFINSGLLVPLQIIGAVGIIWTQLQAYSLIIIGILIISTPLTMIITKKLFFYRISMIGKTDKRIRLTNELVQFIRVVKYYAWESWLIRQIYGVRASELAE
jgi:ATP-binding cassette subfamily C (CFTR/MRP) protein 1